MIGYYGVPPRGTIDKYRNESKGGLLDLDIDYGYEDRSGLPRVFCQIIRNILNNAEHYRAELSLIICSVGEEKCDGGRYAAKVLRTHGFSVLEVSNNSKVSVREAVISVSRLPLKEKILRIMDTVHSTPAVNPECCEPVLGFWGVPPSDLGLLDIFPDETHVFGWTRCVETGACADIDLECRVDDKLPTIFFAQSFCQKSSLAKHLADRHNGLYVDTDRHVTESTRAKVEAFVKLRSLKKEYIDANS